MNQHNRSVTDPSPPSTIGLREHLYYTIVVTLGLVVFVIALRTTPTLTAINWFDLLFFVVLNIVAERTCIVLPHGSKISASFSIVLSALILFNPPIAVTIAAIGNLWTILVEQRRGLRVAAFNVAQYAIAYTVAAWVMQAVNLVSMDLQADYPILQTLLSAGVATLVYLLINIPLVNGYLAVKAQPNIRLGQWLKRLLVLKDDVVDITQTVFFYPIAVMVANFYSREHNLAILLVLMVLIMFGLKFVEQRRLLEDRNERMQVLYEIGKELGELTLHDTDLQLAEQNLFQALLHSRNYPLKRLISNQRCSVYQIEAGQTEQRIIHILSDSLAEHEKIYWIEDEGLLQDVALERRGILSKNLEQTLKNQGESYDLWKNSYTSLLAEPLMVDEKVAYILVLFRDGFPEFTPTDQQQFKLLISHLEINLKNIQLRNRIQQQAIRDGLMGIFNQRYLKRKMDEELSRAKRYHKDLSLILADVDYFKKFNDTHGHLLGDRVLKEIAQILQDSVRETDIVARYGGEELAILLPETPPHAACEVAERIRQNVARHIFTGKDNQPVALSVSIGVSSTQADPNLQVSEMIVHADTALYKAKNQGRNQICLASLESGKLIISTYARGDALPVLERYAGQELREEVRQSWLNAIQRDQMQLFERLEQELAEDNNPFHAYLKKQILAELPALLLAYLDQLHLPREHGSYWSEPVYRKMLELRSKLQQRLTERTQVLKVQELCLISYHFFLQQALQMPLAEPEKKRLFEICYDFFKTLNMVLLTAIWDEFEAELIQSQLSDRVGRRLNQLKVENGYEDQVLESVLSLSCDYLKLADYAFLAQPDPDTQAYRLKVLTGGDALETAQLLRAFSFTLSEVQLENSFQPGLVLELKQPLQLFNQAGLLQKHLPDIQAGLLVPIHYKGQTLGVLGYLYNGSFDMTSRQRKWLQKFADELALSLQLLKRLEGLERVEQTQLPELDRMTTTEFQTH